MAKSSNKGKGKETVELPAVVADEVPAAGGGNAQRASNPHVTPALAATTPDAAETAEMQESGPSAEMSGPVASAVPTTSPDEVHDEDLDATVIRQAVDPIPPMPPERPRRNTLAAATRPRGSTDPNAAPLPPDVSAPRYMDDAADVAGLVPDESIPDETESAEGGEGEWAIADQETIALSPGNVLGARPQFLQTDEVPSWPPRHAAEVPVIGGLSEAAASLRRRAVPRRDRTGQERYASPDGRRILTSPPTGVPPAALPDPRMQRYQELRRQRDAIEQSGGRPQESDYKVTDRVRQWWNDLRPGLKQALEYQHEQRASGVHPIPAYESAPTSRLGDVFGRLTASARELSERAQSVAGPHLKKLHNQAEQAAHAIVDRFDSDTARQQAPFLGPGRIAVFFRSGVSVGQAQRLLSSNEARPLRIIPRKHGFLAYVLPGTEERTSLRLRQHPYVRDVLYIALDSYGDPTPQYEEQ